MQLKRFLCLLLALTFVFSSVMMIVSCKQTDGTEATETTGTNTGGTSSTSTDNKDTDTNSGTSTESETENTNTTIETDSTTPADTEDGTTTTNEETESDETTTETEPDETTAETEPPQGTPIEITYKSNNIDAGSVWGKQTQTIYYGESKTAEVGAVENFGYKFIGWSDGVITPERSADSFYSDKTIYALFEIEAYEMPIIQIETENRASVTSKEVYINAKISIGNTNAAYTLHEYDTEIRGRGNFSWGLPKKSFRIKLNKKQNLLGQGKGPAKSWTLLAYHNDFTLLRGPMTFNFARLLENIPHITSVNLVELYLNGEYNGVYLLCEQTQVNEYRVNVQEELMQTDKGYLIELDNYAEGPSEYRENVGPGGPYQFSAGNRRYEIKSEVYSQAEIDYIKNYVEDSFNAVKTGNRELIETFIDIPSVIDTYIVEELIKNLDAGWSSFYMHKDQGGKLYFGPIWDVDFAGGNSNAYGCENFEELYVGKDHRASQGHPWFITLMKYTWFREEVTARWNEIDDKLATVVPEIIAMDELYKDSLERNFLKWPIFGQNINRTPWAVQQLRSHTENVDYLVNWMTNRIAWLNGEYNSDEFKNGGVDVAELKVSGGKGTLQEPYLISKKADFLSFANMIKLGNDFSGVFFKQTANLSFSRDDYNGLGAPNIFAGFYDGGGNSITVNILGIDNCIFPYVSGTIINLFTMGSINNTEQAAGIARSLRAGGAIINCASTMNITTSSANSGGITASTQNASGLDIPVIVNCYFAGRLSNDSAGPINAHSSGRNVVTENNFYLTGTGTNTMTGETEMSESQMKSSLSNELNDYLPYAELEVLKAVNAEVPLCQWSSSGGSFPIMTRK